jgi:DNA-directed RNA polymerase specialized sigma24 family protein
MSSEWFDSLYRKNALIMVKFAARLLGDRTCEELVQEAFLILLYKKVDCDASESCRLAPFATSGT